ncbi:ribosome maturation factor RimM [Gammaproteobacteria bacterium]|nr:ribosome maturation factor RimM [Gammaproteobacteria bacterium]
MRKNSPVDLSLFLLIAKIGKTRGLKGEFFLRSFAETPDSLTNFTKFYTLASDLMEEVSLEYIKTANSNIVAKIKSIDDIDLIKSFGQRDVYVLRSELPQLEDNEAYWFELAGMRVINLDDKILGEVDVVNNYGASDILEINPQSTSNEKILIPFIKNKFIISIDKLKNIILVDWEEDN